MFILKYFKYPDNHSTNYSYITCSNEWNEINYRNKKYNRISNFPPFFQRKYYLLNEQNQPYRKQIPIQNIHCEQPIYSKIHRLSQFSESNVPNDFRESFPKYSAVPKRLSNKENVNCDFIKKGVSQKNVELGKRNKIYSNLETDRFSVESSRNISKIRSNQFTKIRKFNQTQTAQESVNKLCLKFRPPKISNLLKPTIRGLPMNISFNGIQEKSPKKTKTNLNMIMDWTNDNSQKMDILNNILKENDSKYTNFERSIEHKSSSPRSNSELSENLKENLKINKNLKKDESYVLSPQSTGNQNEHISQNLKKPISNKYRENIKSINDTKLTNFENDFIETYAKKIEEELLCTAFKSVDMPQKIKRNSNSKIPSKMNKTKVSQEKKSDTIGSILDIPLPSENDAFSEYSFFVTNVFKKALEKQSIKN